MLTATFNDLRFVLTGAAAATNSSYPSRVNIDDSGGTMVVEDNNFPSTRVPVFGLSNSVAMSFDVSGLTGAGATIFSANNARVTITGSNQDDYVARFDNNYSNDYITGGRGNDYINAGDGKDVFGGGQGNDSLKGGAGDDFIYGGPGSDQIDGGEDFDTMVLRGARADYNLSVSEGSYMLTYLRGDLDGVNTFANVERLQFSDQVVDISASPSNLTATFNDLRFVLTGAAAATNSSYPSRVNIDDSGGTMVVEDNNSPSTRVPVFGLSNSVAMSFDVSGLTGAGATIFSANNARVTITGSNQDDYVARFDNNYSNDYITGGRGNDYINAGDGKDVFGGGQGNDSLKGGAGDDFIYGGPGSDQIDGGEDFDTMVLRGARADYNLSVSEGSYMLTYLRGDLDGVNTFANVERLQFSDQVVDVEGLFV